MLTLSTPRILTHEVISVPHVYRGLTPGKRSRLTEYEKHQELQVLGWASSNVLQYWGNLPLLCRRLWDSVVLKNVCRSRSWRGIAGTTKSLQ